MRFGLSDRGCSAPHLHADASHVESSWTEAVNTLTIGQFCEPQSRLGMLMNQIAPLQLGSMRIFSANGGGIRCESKDSDLAYLFMPFRALDSGSADRQWMHILEPQPLAYIPPAHLETASTLSAGTVTVLSPEVLCQTTLSMVGSGITLIELQSALSTPRLIAFDADVNRQLTDALYLLYDSIAPLFSAGEAILHHSRNDEQVLRLWVFLLIPELQHADFGFRSSSTVEGASAWVKDLADWIAVHADRPLGLSDLERQSGYSRRSLQLAFRAVLGCTPMQWVKRCRMQMVRERLEHPVPGESVASAAKVAGFFNAASFTRDFVRFYGETPSAVLRRSRR